MQSAHALGDDLESWIYQGTEDRVRSPGFSLAELQVVIEHAERQQQQTQENGQPEFHRLLACRWQ